MRYLIFLVASIFLITCNSEEPDLNSGDSTENTDIYFPPNNSSVWETVSIESLGWDATITSELDDFVSNTRTRAFIILKDGKIAYERYGGLNLNETSDFTKDNYWYWASAAKTLTSFMVGRAEAEGFLSLDEASNIYLGMGWTSLTQEQERAITIRHQLTMTTGLDYTVANADCTEVECLQFLNDPENRWFYHNAPYTLLDGVIAGATGQSFNSYFNSQLRDKIGMEGFWEYSGYNHLFFSPPRSMARFGLLVLAEGNWNGVSVLDNENFYSEMINTSQSLNSSYGYLWWLNGKGSFIPPGQTNIIPSDITPNAPDEMFAAMGKNGQLINIVPSQNLVIVRMGDDPDEGLVPFTFQDAMWEILSQLITQ